MTPDSEQHLTISVDRSEGEVVLALAGELDPHTAPQLDSELEALTGGDGPSRVVLDLTGMTFLDSAGLRVIISGQKALAESGADLVLRHPNDTARRLLEITGLVEHVTVEP